MTRANHTPRAMIRKAPEKRVVATLETVDWLALFPSESDRFMHLSLPTREEQRNDSERGFCYPQPYHTIPLSSKRYGKRYELLIPVTVTCFAVAGIPIRTP